ncbi:hypothetical protein WJX73_004163 [Symbiochloris irregularis]|uniref:EXS domain-containing protein n=1 Tax=Symbiochloris irregularis TaxID=706552 RepID=A0AAW1PUJ4_9CHLO
MELSKAVGLERPKGHQLAEKIASGSINPHANARPPPGYTAQKIAFLVWLIICTYITLSSLATTSNDQYEVFHIYYQPLFVLVAMLWLWCVNVRYFEAHNLRYDLCFSAHDQRYLLSCRQLLQVTALGTVIVGSSATLFAWHGSRHELAAASLHPPVMYCLLVALVLLPANVAYKETRLFFSTTMFRVATPFREVSWADFLLADVVTSLAKALSDTERAICLLISGTIMQPHDSDQVCGNASWLIPLGLSLPYAWRLLQCLRVYTDTGARPQLFNALKYSTAFPVILLSSLKYQVTPNQWDAYYKPLWLASAFLNSAYSYFWDLERDWEIKAFTSRQGEPLMGCVRKPPLPNKISYWPGFYYYLMASNLILRLSWTYKLSPHLRHNHATVMGFTLLEVIRRFQWMFVRVEVELRKIQAHKPEHGQLVPPPPPPAAEKEDDENTFLI